MTPEERYQQHCRDVLQRSAEYYGFASYAELEAARAKRKARQDRREKLEMDEAVGKPLMDVLKRIKDVLKKAEPARDEMRVGLASLETDEAARMLSDYGKLTRRRAIMTAASQAIGTAGGQALALASAVKAGRDAVTGRDAVLKRARLVELLPNPYKEDRIDQINESRLLREELMRMRLRGDLMEADGSTLAEMVAEAAGTNNHAMLAMVQRAVRKRAATESGNDFVPAQSALVSALEAITVPPDIAELDSVFEEIDAVAWKLSEALAEIETGRPPNAPRESVERVGELTAEHGPLDGAAKFAAERAEARRLGQKAATKRVEKEVAAAVQADLADTAELNATNPVA